MENHDFVENDSTNAYLELKLIEFMVESKASPIELTGFYVISKGFLKLWNQNLGELLGDGDLKNYVYQYILDEVGKNVIPKHIPQPLVDEYVDLIFDFLNSAGYVSETILRTEPIKIKFHNSLIERYNDIYNNYKKCWKGDHKQFIYAILSDIELNKITSNFTEKDWSLWDATPAGKEVSKAIKEYDLYGL